MEPRTKEQIINREKALEAIEDGDIPIEEIVELYGDEELVAELDWNVVYDYVTENL